MMFAKKTLFLKILRYYGLNLRTVYKFDIKSFVNLAPDKYWYEIANVSKKNVNPVKMSINN